jgi:hypothetical protein
MASREERDRNRADWEPWLERLEQTRARAYEMGGPERLEKHHAAGKHEVAIGRPERVGIDRGVVPLDGAAHPVGVEQPHGLAGRHQLREVVGERRGRERRQRGG